ncbi:BrnA antitoxin family protein [Shinella fusca]|uniref:Uncharacterized protein (DUF4415 family) n=1 Tax=Shinella fusca TaxID=544480 RepID=A0A7W7YUC4_9HYPH|nr:BrnA antitoxin family protein [Shinella fusca]MBB5042448.1 uncharacterized protein (DUF4415 family) [Shinella fusca]
MSKDRIVRYTFEEIEEKIAKGGDRSDWARVDAMTDEDILANMRDDPDWADFIDVDWSKTKIVVPAQKTSISIRLDADIVDFFKATGKGYQTRINAVLRHYMDEQGKGKKSG